MKRSTTPPVRRSPRDNSHLLTAPRSVASAADLTTESSGAIVVYARLDGDGEEVFATRVDADRSFLAHVQERRIAGRMFYCAVFPDLPPGAYTVLYLENGDHTDVTVTAGTVVQVDWRTLMWGWPMVELPDARSHDASATITA